MSEMRATGRLLEVIEQAAEELGRDVSPDLRSRVAVIASAATELRRRGDTLVCMADLRLVTAAAILERERAIGEGAGSAAFEGALARICASLGGVL